MSTPTTYALKARTIIPLDSEKPSLGEMLYAPLKKIDNGLILIEKGQIVTLGRASQINLPASCQVFDVGDFCLIPGVVNAHTHLDLAFLQGQTTWGEGFTPWLKSLIPKLPRGDFAKDSVIKASLAAIDSLAHLGTRFVGDIAGSAEGLLSEISSYAQKNNLSIQHFCEWFGFEKSDSPKSSWPSRVALEIANDSELEKRCSQAGHALYSTSPSKLRQARAYCQKHHLTFSLHLAESYDETEMLTSGQGPLYELYKDKVLPDNWRPPNMRPLAYAAYLKLLGPGMLAVHGTTLDAQEAQVLAASATALCLCPRSNFNLGLGLPKVEDLISENVLLCLGTDGLTSNKDLDVCNEALFLQEKLDIPPEALIRMLTVNGAAALGLKGAGRLTAGSLAAFCALPKELTF